MIFSACLFWCLSVLDSDIIPDTKLITNRRKKGGADSGIYAYPRPVVKKFVNVAHAII